MYLEEDVTKNVELPNNDGQFNVSRGRYKVCGDDDDQTGASHSGNNWNTRIRVTYGIVHLKHGSVCTAVVFLDFEPVGSKGL